MVEMYLSGVLDGVVMVFAVLGFIAFCRLRRRDP